MSKAEIQKSYLGPFLTMVFLFFIVGFLTTANTQFQGPLKSAFLSDAGSFKNTMATLITFSWFLAYPVFGNVGARLVACSGYKGTLVRGLLMMIGGIVLLALSSWVTTTFPEWVAGMGGCTVHCGFFVFLLGSFVVGGSATVLQVVINPYLTACEVRGTQSVQRMAIGGTSNSIGTTIAPYFVSGIVFGGLSMSDVSVSQLLAPFSALSIVLVVVAFTVTRLDLPDLDNTHTSEGESLERSVWSFRHLTLGVVAIFFYVGCEVCIGANINLYALGDGGGDVATATLMATLYWGGLLVGRLAGSFFRSISPRTQLTFTTSVAALLVVVGMAADNPWVLVCVGLMHSIMWGAIFTLAVSHLGKYTSVASGVFMIGVIGGAVLPLMQGVIADATGEWRWSWLIVLVGELCMLAYARIGSRVRRGDMIQSVAMLLVVLGSSTLGAAAQTTGASLVRQVAESGCLRRPLPLDTALSMESLSLRRKVLREESLPVDGWQHSGLGRLIRDKDIRLLVPVETGNRAKGTPGDPDYAIYGTSRVALDTHGRDLTAFNRVSMDVYPRCKGTGIMNLNLVIDNSPAGSLGAHLINLRNNRWNHVVFDMSGVRRDHVSGLQMYTDVKGRNLFVGDSLEYVIRNVRLEATDGMAKERGWDVAQGMIAYSMSGYMPFSSKVAVLGFDAKRFDVVDALTGERVYSGNVKSQATTIGTFRVADFSGLRREGSYVLRAEGHATRPFLVSTNAFTDSQWRVLNFIFCQRCGSAVTGIHGVCHGDLFAMHDGRRVSYGGGWHDAGDLSQQTLQSGDVAFALDESYNALKAVDRQLALRMKEEALHGYRFILQTRFGDGWHASSMGLLHWTDGITGTPDDITTVRTQDNSFDNFLYAGYEAYAALAFSGDDIADTLRRVAVEDFDMARRKFDSHGFDTFQHMMEHTYNTPRSLYMAVMSWSASQLYRLTGSRKYADLAARYIDYTLKCQETSGNRAELRGYFYRDDTRRSITHFIHQSRDQMYAMALAELCRTQPGASRRAAWMSAMRLYADYLKSLARYTAPY